MKTELKTISSILKDNFPSFEKKHKVTTLELFGSFIRNEQTSNSDLDVLVSFSETPSMFEFLEFEEYLSKLLDLKVDLVMRSSLKPSIGKRILSEAQSVI